MKHYPKKKQLQGFTIVEIMVVVVIIAILAGLAWNFGAKPLIAHTRKKTCLNNQMRLMEVKQLAWTKYEDLTTQADPDGCITENLDTGKAPYCPLPGAHQPASEDLATAVNTLASYDLLATSELARPTCRISAAQHKP